jgi:hypothetical protein
VVSGVAVPVSVLPVATPTRRVPKSKDRSDRGGGKLRATALTGLPFALGAPG